MIQTVILYIIIALAVGYAIHALILKIKRKKGYDCGCGNSCNCDKNSEKCKDCTSSCPFH